MNGLIDDPVSVAFGLAVAAAGVLFWVFGVTEPTNVPSGEEERREFDFLTRQAARRRNVAIGFLLCGMFLTASGLIDADEHSTLSFVFGLASLPILCWAILVALGDWALSHRHATKNLRSIESQREQMERAIAEYKARS